MSPYILIIFLLVGIAVGYYFTRKGGTPQGFFGKRSVEKEGNKTKILAEFASKGK